MFLIKPLEVPPSSDPEAHISYAWDEERQIFVATWTGVITDRVLLRCYEAYYSAPDYDPACRELADLRGLTGVKLTTEGLKKLAELAQRYHRSGRTATLAPTDISYGLGRMYHVFGPDASTRFEVFRELPAALEWLQADPTD